MKTYTLNKWSVQADPWQAPECRGLRLCGFREEGDEHRVITSPVVDVKGRECTTESGTLYILGEIDPDYLQWLKDNGKEYNYENPIKDLRSSRKN